MLPGCSRGARDADHNWRARDFTRDCGAGDPTRAGDLLITNEQVVGGVAKGRRGAFRSGRLLQRSQALYRRVSEAVSKMLTRRFDLVLSDMPLAIEVVDKRMWRYASRSSGWTQTVLPSR